MFNLRAKPARPPAHEKSLKRLEFEMALEIGGTDGRSMAERLRDAASAAGGDLLFMLPAASGNGETTVVRFAEGDGDRLVQVRTWQETYAIAEEPDMDPEVLSFARASIDVLERLRTDRQVLEPLKTAAY
jgi:hypothetical protein